MKKQLWIPKRMFYRVLWPSTISALALAAADIADALVVGSRVGEKGLAAIGIVTPVYMIYNLIGYGFSTGGCVTHGRLTSAGKETEALCHFRRLAVRLLEISVGIAVLGNVLLRPLLSLLGADAGHPELLRLCEEYGRPLLTACPVFMLNFILYDFVRCDDDPGLASTGFTVGCAADLGLNILLVLILGMGVRGSIIATVAAQAISAALMSIHLFRDRGVLCLRGIVRAVDSDPAATRRSTRRSLNIGFSASVRFIFQTMFLSLGNRLLLRAGDLGIIDGDLYVAVFDVVMNVSYVALALYQASSETMQPLASVFSEEHDRKSLRCTLRLGLTWGMAAGAAVAGLLALFAPSVSAFFGLTDTASRAVSIPAIRIFCLSVLPAGVLIILTGYFQSVGRQGTSRMITLLRGALFLIPAAFVFGWFLPERFWWLFAVCECASLLVTAGSVLLHRRAQNEQIPVFSAAMDNNNHELGQVLNGLEAYCEARGLSIKKTVLVRLAAEELCLVTMQQAFTGKPDEYIQVTACAETNGDCTLWIRNSAPRFNPFAMETGRLQQNARKELLDSMGVLMVKKQAREMHYRNYEGFNVLMVVL